MMDVINTLEQSSYQTGSPGEKKKKNILNEGLSSILFQWFLMGKPIKKHNTISPATI